MKAFKFVVIVSLALLLLFALIGCGSGGSSGGPIVMDEPVPAGAEGAHIVELTFSPEDIKPDTIALKAGEKVLFVIKNTDPKEDHNLVGTDVSLKEIIVHPGQTVRRLWTASSKNGNFAVGCTIHPEIRMKFNIQ